MTVTFPFPLKLVGEALDKEKKDTTGWRLFCCLLAMGQESREGNEGTPSDRSGAGVSVDDLIGWCSRFRKRDGLPALSRRVIAETLKKHDGKMWNVVDGVIWRRSYKRFYPGYSRVAHIPAASLRSLQSFRAHLYSALHGKEEPGNPWSRKSLEETTTVTGQSQRNYEKLTETEKLTNIADTGIHMAHDWHPPLDMQRLGYFTGYRDGEWVMLKRLPNSYWCPGIALTGRRRGFVVPADNSPEGLQRMFFDTPNAAMKHRGRLVAYRDGQDGNVVYWRNLDASEDELAREMLGGDMRWRGASQKKTKKAKASRLAIYERGRHKERTVREP